MCIQKMLHFLCKKEKKNEVLRSYISNWYKGRYRIVIISWYMLYEIVKME